MAARVDCEHPQERHREGPGPDCAFPVGREHPLEREEDRDHAHDVRRDQCPPPLAGVAQEHHRERDADSGDPIDRVAVRPEQRLDPDEHPGDRQHVRRDQRPPPRAVDQEYQ